MAISPAERRFIQYWDEQRKGSKTGYLAMYSLAYFIALFMLGVVIGLFSGLRIVTVEILIGLALISFVGAILLSWWQRRRNEHKFRKILQRELKNSVGEN